MKRWAPRASVGADLVGVLRGCIPSRAAAGRLTVVAGTFPVTNARQRFIPRVPRASRQRVVLARRARSGVGGIIACRGSAFPRSSCAIASQRTQRCCESSVAQRQRRRQLHGGMRQVGGAQRGWRAAPGCSAAQLAERAATPRHAAAQQPHGGGAHVTWRRHAGAERQQQRAGASRRAPCRAVAAVNAARCCRWEQELVAQVRCEELRDVGGGRVRVAATQRGVGSPLEGGT